MSGKYLMIEICKHVLRFSKEMSLRRLGNTCEGRHESVGAFRRLYRKVR